MQTLPQTSTSIHQQLIERETERNVCVWVQVCAQWKGLGDKEENEWMTLRTILTNIEEKNTVD